MTGLTQGEYAEMKSQIRKVADWVVVGHGAIAAHLKKHDFILDDPLGLMLSR